MRLGLSLFVLVLCPPSAMGQTFFLGDEAALKGGAVTATVNDSSAIFYNPSGMANALEQRFDFSASGFLIRTRPVPNYLNLVDGTNSTSEDIGSTTIATAPSALGYVYRLHPDWTLGAALFVPESDSESIRVTARSGTGVNFVDDASATNGAEVSLEANVIQVIYDGSVGLAYRLSDTIRLGVTGSVLYSESTEAQSLDSALVRPGIAPIFDSVTVRSELSSIALRGGVGFQWDAHPNVTVGGVLRSFSVRLANASSEIEQIQRTNGSTATFQVNEFNQEAVTLANDEPGVGSLGVALRFPRTTVNLDVELVGGRDPITDTLEGEQFTLRPELDLTVNVKAGFVHRLGEETTVGAGVFTRFSDPQTQARLGSSVDFYGITAGVIFDDLLNLAESEDDRAVVFGSSIGLRYALGFADIETLVIDVSSPEGFGSRSSRLESSVFHEVGLHLGTGLRWK